MLKTTKEINTAMLDVLKGIKDGLRYPFNLIDKYEETDILNILDRCVKMGYVKGLSVRWSGDNIPTVWGGSNTELTFEAIEFMERYQN